MATIITILYRLIDAYIFLIVVSALFSWIPSLYNSAVGRFLRRITDPYLAIFDRIIPTFGGISISPIVAIAVLYLVQRLLGSIFMKIGIY